MELLSVREVAKLLKISGRQVYALQARGAIPPAVKLGGSTRWRRDDLERWLSELPAGRPAEETAVTA